MFINIVITGSVNLIFTIVAMGTVDKLGRKKLLLLGSAGLAIIYLILGLFDFMNISGWTMLLLVVMAITVVFSVVKSHGADQGLSPAALVAHARQ